jgi:hypothetical protein
MKGLTMDGQPERPPRFGVALLGFLALAALLMAS